MGHILTSYTIGWYLTFALLLNDSIVELPLYDTSRFFAKRRKAE
jgi:Fic family protein